MCGGPGDRNDVKLPGHHVGCAGASTQIGRASRAQPGFRPLSAPSPEFEHPCPARRMHHAGSFRGHERFEIDNRKQVGFDNLGFGNRRRDLKDGLFFEDHRPLVHRRHCPGEAKPPEVIKKRVGNGSEGRMSAQETDMLLREMKAFEVIEARLNARRHQERALRRKVTDKELERGATVHVPLEISGRHGQLVQINQQGRV